MTRAACIVGYPVKHSRSPKLHGFWLQRLGIDGDYRAEEVTPEDFPAFLQTLDARGYVGCNVTIPHKEAAFALTEPDARAKAIGAANTLWLDNGRLRSTNTDVDGFIGSLDAAAPGWDRRTTTAVVLGAGGGSRAIVYGLIERGIGTIHVVNRTFARAEAFRRQFGASVHPVRWEDLPRVMQGSGLLVNATSLGMQGGPGLVLDISGLGADAVVSDIVYIPLETPLLAAAKRRGLETANGLDMLLHQAVRGFELWFGVRPQVTAEQFDMLAADIGAS